MISSLIDDYPDRIAVVTYHVNDAFEVPWGHDREYEFYGLPGTVPSIIYDGWWFCPDDDITYCFQQRLAEPTDVTIDLSAEQVQGDQWRVTAHVCLDIGCADRVMRIYTTAELDDHPNPPEDSRYTLMQDGQTQDVALAPGGCTDVVSTIRFDATSWGDQENIAITAWAQAPSASGPADVYQAAQIYWPFAENPRLTTITVDPPSADLVVGEQRRFTATGWDQHGQSFGLTDPSWSLSGDCEGSFDPASGSSSTYFTATGTGTCQLSCQQSGVSGTASIAVSDDPPQLVSIIVNPETSELEVDGQLLFTATGSDQFGNAYPLESPQWSTTGVGGGTFVPPSGSASPIFNATHPGVCQVICEQAGVTGTASVTITGDPPQLSAIMVDPATATLEVGEQLALIAIGSDQYGQAVTLTSVNWTTAGPGEGDGSFDPASGSASTVFTADRPGACTVVAEHGGVSGSASLEITGDPPRLAVIEISPASAELQPGQSVSFTATGTDQYGASIDLANPVWTVSGSGSGILDPVSGSPTTVFEATGLGTAVITCTEDDIAGMATVEIAAFVPPAPRRPGSRHKP